MEYRPYDPDRDRDGLWRCKRAFERELGSGTGDDGKEAAYEAKLTDAYRERYLAWVRRCRGDDPRCVTVADAGGEIADDSGDVTDEDGPTEPTTAADRGEGTAAGPEGRLAGYVFVLPERLAMIWDAAVLNEIYVAPERRGTGVADRLLDAAVEFARDQDLPMDRLVLDVDPDNERAGAFYERHGFEPWGEMVARDL